MTSIQKLALLGIGLHHLDRELPQDLTQLRARRGELHESALGISRDVQALSHQLHSPKLEYLSLVSAMEGFCREFSERHQVEARFSQGRPESPAARGFTLALPHHAREIEQCEVKYSDVKKFEVKLAGQPDGIRLAVSDSGSGFDVDNGLRGRGIGLISMRERVRLVNGSFSITSKLERGTTVEVEVPLNGREKAAKGASGT
jgi:signal transduction histidine kinase